MAKAANVTISRSIAIGGGLITVVCRGDVASVKAAVDAGSKAAAKVGELVASHVIPRPHDEVARGFPRRNRARRLQPRQEMTLRVSRRFVNCPSSIPDFHHIPWLNLHSA